MGMRFRRPNRRLHAPYPRRVQMTALVLGPWTWFLVLFLAGATSLPFALFLWAALVAAIWCPWDQWSAAAAAMPKPETPAERLQTYQDTFTETTSTAWNTPTPEAEPAARPTIIYSARKVYGREGAEVTGHYRRTKSGRKVWVRRHYRRG